MAKQDDNLIAAVKVVNEAIRVERERLEKMARTEEAEPIMVEGNTTTGYYCQMMVNPREVAKILVDYDYALYRVLGEEAPTGMWEDLGRKFGLETVSGFDL